MSSAWILAVTQELSSQSYLSKYNNDIIFTVHWKHSQSQYQWKHWDQWEIQSARGPVYSGEHSHVPLGCTHHSLPKLPTTLVHMMQMWETCCVDSACLIGRPIYVGQEVGEIEMTYVNDLDIILYIYINELCINIYVCLKFTTPEWHICMLQYIAQYD